MDSDSTPQINGGPEQPAEGLPDIPADGASSAQNTPEANEPTRLEYLKNMLPAVEQRRKRPLWLAVLLVVILLGGGTYWYLKQHRNPATKQTHQSSATQTVRPSLNQAASGNNHYVSNGNDLNLDFDYPSNWTVSPPSGNNSSDQTITLNSPLTSITNPSGSVVTGKVTLTIRPGSTQLNELNGSVTAAQASLQFAYSKPTTAQHQYPYLTFLHFGASNATAFQEVMVTGTLQFPQGTNVTPAGVTVDPIISASFYSCTSTTCAGSTAVPLSITNDTWQNTPLFRNTLAIIESMQLN